MPGPPGPGPPAPSPSPIPEPVPPPGPPGPSPDPPSGPGLSGAPGIAWVAGFDSEGGGSGKTTGFAGGGCRRGASIAAGFGTAGFARGTRRHELQGNLDRGARRLHDLDHEEVGQDDAAEQNGMEGKGEREERPASKREGARRHPDGDRGGENRRGRNRRRRHAASGEERGGTVGPVSRRRAAGAGRAR